MLDFSKFGGMQIKCAGLGEVLFDVYPTGPKIGGAPANFAFHCKQLGLDALVVSSVGNDELGFTARNLLASKFLPALLLLSDKCTGAVNVVLNKEGVPSYVFLEDAAYDNIKCCDLLLEVAKRVQLACFGTLAQRGVVSHETVMQFLDAMNESCRIRVFDVNLRRNYFSKEVIEESLKRTEIFKCNEDELPVLCEIAGIKNATAQAYRDYLAARGIYCFIFTEGAKQSTVFLNDEISIKKTPVIKAVDTVGAGDSFTASLVSLLMQGKSLNFAHEKAVEISAFVCTQQGAMPELSTKLKETLKL